MVDAVLYKIKNCPKCLILSNMAKQNSDKLKNYNYREIFIDDIDENEKNELISNLVNKGMLSFPVLYVDYEYLDFNKAVSWFRSYY